MMVSAFWFRFLAILPSARTMRYRYARSHVSAGPIREGLNRHYYNIDPA